MCAVVIQSKEGCGNGCHRESCRSLFFVATKLQALSSRREQRTEYTRKKLGEKGNPRATRAVGRCGREAGLAFWPLSVTCVPSLPFVSRSHAPLQHGGCSAVFFLFRPALILNFLRLGLTGATFIHCLLLPKRDSFGDVLCVRVQPPAAKPSFSPGFLRVSRTFCLIAFTHNHPCTHGIIDRSTPLNSFGLRSSSHPNFSSIFPRTSTEPTHRSRHLLLWGRREE